MKRSLGEKAAQSGCLYPQVKPLAVPVSEIPVTEKQDAEFDEFAAAYDAALDRGLRFTGESKEYFADTRLAWSKQVLGEHFQPGWRCLDFGCGTGTATPYLQKHLAASQIVGVDPSQASCDLATGQFGGDSVRFTTPEQLAGEREPFDFAYCNGVFHQIGRAHV